VSPSSGTFLFPLAVMALTVVMPSTVRGAEFGDRHADLSARAPICRIYLQRSHVDAMPRDAGLPSKDERA
jgi:hypothetical protein